MFALIYRPSYRPSVVLTFASDVLIVYVLPSSPRIVMLSIVVPITVPLTVPVLDVLLPDVLLPELLLPELLLPEPLLPDVLLLPDALLCVELT